MSYLDKLRASRDKPQVAYQEFALHTRTGKDGLFCFFEGKDNAYYIPRIKNFTDKYHPINCGGREKVLAVYQLIIIHSEYDKYKKAFFIDQDFNNPLPSRNPPIFETPCYSIENFYVSVDVFKQIIINEFHLSEVSDRSFKVCLQCFEARQKEFHQATTLLNAWYACLIEIRNTEQKKTGVNLSDKLPKEFINFSLESISANYDLDKIKQTFKDALEVQEENFQIKLSEFSNCKHHQVFRGKYEMQFLVTFIDMILQDSLNDQKYIKQKIKFAFNQKLTNEQAINVFSGYAETPESLNSYLKQVIS
jgi:hypothetical protein